MSWTPENTALAARLWQEGKSATQIARALSVIVGVPRGWPTRNAVIGKLNRKGLLDVTRTVGRRAHSHVNASTFRQRAPVRSMREPKPKAPAYIVLGRLHEGKPATPLPPLREIAPTVEPRHWLTRKFGECACPVSGEGADVLSCCAPVIEGASWCGAHKKIGTQPGRGAWASTEGLIHSVRMFAK